MSRRARALVFLLLALLAAALAAAIADGYGSSVARGYGPLRPVVVAARDLAAGKPLGPAAGRARSGAAAGAGAVRARRARWTHPRMRLGWSPVARDPGRLLPARRAAAAAAAAAGSARPALGPRRHPVEIAVSGAEALLAAGAGAARDEGRRGRDDRTERAPARAGPTSRRPRCRCSRWARVPTGPVPAAPRRRPWG